MELELIAHRGFSAMAPENTLVAFSSALLSGADSLEFDLQITADGIPVIFHDANLERITGKKGTIREKKLEELKQLDAGAWFSERYAGETIPTLQDAIAAFKEVKQYLYFDVKQHCEWTDAEISKFAEVLKTEGLVKKSIITSFKESFLERIRRVIPDIKIGYFIVESSEYKQQLAKAVAVKNSILSCYYSVVLDNPHWVEESRSQGVDIMVWTVDDFEDVQALVKIGVTRITTNSLIGELNPELLPELSGS